MSGFSTMAVFYAMMTGLPFLMWVIAVTSPVQSLLPARAALAALLGLGSIVFGIIGFREVFMHG